MMGRIFEVGYRIALIVGFLVVGFFIAYNFAGISSDGKSCLKQPLLWGAQVASEKFDGHVSCSCSVSDQVFYFSESGFRSERNPFMIMNESLSLGG